MVAAVLHTGGGVALLVAVLIALVVALIAWAVFHFVAPQYAGPAALVTFLVVLLLELL